MNSDSIPSAQMRRCLVTGFLIWLGASVALRLAGQYLLHPDDWLAIAVLFGASFPLMALLARRICARVPRAQWAAAGILLVMPSLLLDACASVFFFGIYPNMPAQAAGLFGGWILWCCAGALLGVNFAKA